jgi:hypothetical protein
MTGAARVQQHGRTWVCTECLDGARDAGCIHSQAFTHRTVSSACHGPPLSTAAAQHAWGLRQEPSWGRGLCMALRRPGLIRHGRCRSRACDLRGPLIVLDAAAISQVASQAPRLGARSFVVACATSLLAHRACSHTALLHDAAAASATVGRRWLARALADPTTVGPPRAVQCTMTWRAVSASRRRHLTNHGSRLSALACQACVRPSGEPCGPAAAALVAE